MKASIIRGRILPVLVAVVMMFAAVPFISGNAHAETTVNFFNITHYLSGPKYGGDVVLGGTISFDPNKIIEQEGMSEVAAEAGNIRIYSRSADPESESFNMDFTIGDDDLITWKLRDNVGLAGESFRIYFDFYVNEGADIVRYQSSTIRAVADMSDVPVTGIVDKTYTGKPLTQDLGKIMLGEIELIEDQDFWVDYQNNKNAGTATVFLYGKGKYAGTAQIDFTIAKASNPLKISARTATVIYSKLKKKTQTLKVSKVIKFKKKGQGKMTYTKVTGNKKITVNKKTGKVTVKRGLKKGKTYKVKIKVKAAGNSNYKSGSKTVTAKVKVK